MKNNRGFTLIELILSLAILSIIIVPSFNMLIIAMKGNVASKDELVSSMEIQKLMEEIKNDDDLSGFIVDNNEHFLSTDDSIKYIIEPVDFYSNNDSTILYKVSLFKIMDGKVVQEFIGTKIVY